MATLLTKISATRVLPCTPPENEANSRPDTPVKATAGSRQNSTRNVGLSGKQGGNCNRSCACRSSTARWGSRSRWLRVRWSTPPVSRRRSIRCLKCWMFEAVLERSPKLFRMAQFFVDPPMKRVKEANKSKVEPTLHLGVTTYENHVPTRSPVKLSPLKHRRSIKQ